MEQLPNIVRERLQATAKPGSHPDPDLLAAFAENSLAERERAPLLQHLADCAECREVLAVAQLAAHEEHQEVLQLVAAAPPQRSLATLAAPRATVMRPRWRLWRWGALAASCVIVVAAVWLGRPGREQKPALYAERDAPLGMVASQPAATTSTASEDRLASPSVAEKKPAPSAPASVPAQKKSTRFSILGKDKDKSEFNTKKMAGLAAGSRGDAAVLGGPMPAPAAPPPAAQSTKVLMGKGVSGGGQGTAAHEVLELQRNEPNAAGGLADLDRQKDKTANAAAAQPQSESVADARADFKTSANQGLFRAAAMVPIPRWTLSSEGKLQRSYDAGKTWHPVPVGGDEATFQALSFLGSDIWVGGHAGLLYHSPDAGVSWTQVKPSAKGTSLTADIVLIDFSDSQHGLISTANKELWTTSDAGLTWQKQ